MEEGNTFQEIAHLLNGNGDASPFPGYDPEVPGGLGEFGGTDNEAIQELERSFADSVLAALEHGNARENSCVWSGIEQTRFDSQCNSVVNDARQQRAPAPANIYGNYTPTTSAPQLATNQNLRNNATAAASSASTNAGSTNMNNDGQMFTFSTDVYANIFSAGAGSSAPVLCKEEPISPGIVASPRPASNISASTNSGYGADNTCSSGAEDLGNLGHYLESASPSSSEEGRNVQGAKSTQAANRRPRRQYSRDIGLSGADLQRRERRREQNRRAAEKCRVKNKVKNDTTLKEYQILQSTNTTLQNQVKTLEKQRLELQAELDRHMAICPLLQR